MLGVYHRAVFLNDDVSVEVFGNAVDEVLNIDFGDGLFLNFVRDVIGEVPDLLEPTVQEGYVLTLSVVKLGLLLLLIHSVEILGQRLEIVLLLEVERMESSRLLCNSHSPLGMVDEGCPEIV